MEGHEHVCAGHRGSYMPRGLPLLNKLKPKVKRGKIPTNDKVCRPMHRVKRGICGGGSMTRISVTEILPKLFPEEHH
jgi:hypothetical protein